MRTSLHACRLAIAALGLVVAVAAARADDPAALLAGQAPEVSAFEAGGRSFELMDWRLNDIGVSGLALHVMVVAMAPEAAGWSVVPVDRSGGRAALLKQLDCPDAVVVTSGGFFVEDDAGTSRPLGLAVADGKQVSPFGDRRYGGVLAQIEGQTAIFPVRAFPQDRPWQEALQSSPIVVADGANDMNGDDGQAANRLAVGLDADGGLVVVGAFRAGHRALSLYAFADLIVALKAAAGIDVRTALALDGGPSAGLYVPSLDAWDGSRGIGYVPDALCFRAMAP